MLTSKQRAKLRAIANTEETVIQIGKSGIGDTLVAQTQDALKAREIIKAKVLETSPMPVQYASRELAKLTKSDVVQVIGTKFVLYKRNHQNPKISLK